MTEKSLIEAFEAGFGVFWGAEGGSVARLFEFIHADARIVDEDIPFVLSRDEWRRHVDFHLGGVWESLRWYPFELKARAHGGTGVLTGFATLQGKPRDHGFRQRHLRFSIVATRRKDGWQALSISVMPILGTVLNASPG